MRVISERPRSGGYKVHIAAQRMSMLCNTDSPQTAAQTQKPMGYPDGLPSTDTDQSYVYEPSSPTVSTVILKITEKKKEAKRTYETTKNRAETPCQTDDTLSDPIRESDDMWRRHCDHRKRFINKVAARTRTNGATYYSSTRSKLPYTQTYSRRTSQPCTHRRQSVHEFKLKSLREE